MLYNKKTLTKMWEHEFKNQYSNISFPTVLTDEIIHEIDSNIYVLHNTKPPYIKSNEKVVEDGVEIIDNKYYIKYRITSLLEDEVNIIADSVRYSRNQLLAECDWTQGKDISDNISSIWLEYRQALRDITNQEGFPFNVIWPVKP